MSEYSAREVVLWSVEDVIDFVESLGFANKSEAIQNNGIDGARLLSLSLDGLKEAGFLGLQAKKIKNSLPKTPIPVIVPPAARRSTSPHNNGNNNNKNNSNSGGQAPQPPPPSSIATAPPTSSDQDLATSATSSATNPAYVSSSSFATNPSYVNTATPVPVPANARNTGSSTTNSDEVLALRLELQELREQMTNLMKEKKQTSIVPSSTANKPPTVQQQEQVVPGFCSGCVIRGNQVHTLTVTLGPGDVVRADPGAMVHMSSYIEMKTKTENAVGRFFTGQGLFQTEFTYRGPPGTADTICFTPDFPGQIIACDLSRHGGHVVCQKNSLLCNASTIRVQVEFTQSLGAGFFGGEGFILQGLVGSGMAFLNARGSIIQMELKPNERRTVATGCLVGFASTVKYSVRPMPGLMNALFGGEGLFVTELVGPGTVWIESHDMSRLYRSLNSAMNKH